MNKRHVNKQLKDGAYNIYFQLFMNSYYSLQASTWMKNQGQPEWMNKRTGQMNKRTSEWTSERWIERVNEQANTEWMNKDRVNQQANKWIHKQTSEFTSQLVNSQANEWIHKFTSWTPSSVSSTAKASRAFRHSAPVVWNNLSANTRWATSPVSFKQLLKTELFASAFGG